MAFDPWDLKDVLDLDSVYPLDTIHCFWDEMPMCDDVSKSLLSTPIADVSKSLLSTPIADVVPDNQSLVPIRKEDLEASSTSGGKGNAFRGDFQGGSPRTKRRRILFREPGSTFDSREEFPNNLQFLPEIQEPAELRGLTADSFGYRDCDAFGNSSGDVLDGGSCRRMPDCMQGEDWNNNTPDEMKMTLPGCYPSVVRMLYTGEEDLRGPGTPLLQGSNTHASKPIVERNQPSPPSTPNAAKMSAQPVAYPFTLLKREGSLTLKQINERLLLPPSRPVPHVVGGDSWCRPSSHLGLGLSGKSVVARTRIHTTGNGTITIMRTRD